MHIFALFCLSYNNAYFLRETTPFSPTIMPSFSHCSVFNIYAILLLFYLTVLICLNPYSNGMKIELFYFRFDGYKDKVS